jgi:hypothetical protein
MHTDDNPGHTFANLIWSLYLYESNNLNCKVVIPRTLLSISRQFLEIVLLYVTSKNIVIIDSGDVILAETAHLYDGSWHLKYEYMGKIPNKFNESILEFYPEKNFSIAKEVVLFQEKIRAIEYSGSTYSNKVISIKTQSSNSSFNGRAFNSAYETHYQSRGFDVLKPENLNIIEYLKVLNSAKEIITSWGAISYIAKLGFSKYADVTILCHEGYRSEYEEGDWQLKNCFLPECNKIKYIFDLSTNLASDSRIR